MSDAEDVCCWYFLSFAIYCQLMCHVTKIWREMDSVKWFTEDLTGPQWVKNSLQVLLIHIDFEIMTVTKYYSN